MVTAGGAIAGLGAGRTSGFLIGGSGSCADGDGYCGEAGICGAVGAGLVGDGFWGTDGELLVESCLVGMGEGDARTGTRIAVKTIETYARLARQ